ncbi:hypothetical protein [Nocardioides pinisoli]|uniref:WD40 repeat domain-containing protein n=1 Tax=Nocardioides pinisoli TaxID=2950279 RepID=A0ABT1KTK9_9ACTN|nr:hypothetical protein [Nocardioides pinisoli]MCP3421083.1 hypothetical protein [Nocardioides pinisoli]
MLRSRRAATVLGALATATSLAASALAPAQAATPTVELQPQQLTRGADIAVPHVEDGRWGDVFVDGARRVELPGRVARVIGRSGDSWLVGTNNVDRKRNRRVVRVAADGSVTDVLRNIDPSTVIVSADGSTLAWQRFVSKGRKVITYAARASDGETLGAKGPTGYVDLLDVDAEKVVLGSDSRTFAWSFSRGRTRTLAKGMSGDADLALDLLTTWTEDPYLGGCMVVSRLSRPGAEIWRSCRDRVAAFSPDGTQMLTFHKLTDGLGPGEIHLRRIDGTRLATWTTGWFGSWQWESAGAVLLGVNGQRKSATVRCTLDACENATDPVAVQTP